ncbi:MAG: hypothetical protein R3F60_24080 [bacterium]
MKNVIVCALALTFGLTACGPEEDATSVPETRSTVQALVTVEGSNGESAEFVVEVSHEDTVDEEEARRLVRNIRVRQRPTFDETPDTVGVRVIRPANEHWLVPEDHDVGVQVVPVDPDMDKDRYEWDWVDQGLVFPHCPEGRHF